MLSSMNLISTKSKYFSHYHQIFPYLSSLFSSISTFFSLFLYFGHNSPVLPLENLPSPKMPGKIKHIVGKTRQKQVYFIGKKSHIPRPCSFFPFKQLFQHPRSLEMPRKRRQKRLPLRPGNCVPSEINTLSLKCILPKSERFTIRIGGLGYTCRKRWSVNIPKWACCWTDFQGSSIPFAESTALAKSRKEIKNALFD